MKSRDIRGVVNPAGEREILSKPEPSFKGHIGRTIDPEICHYTLAVMATAGLYETSGDRLYDVGVPGKSGIGGGIVTISLGKGALGTFAPPLDNEGNSVKGQLVAKYFAQQLGMDLFASKPELVQESNTFK